MSCRMRRPATVKIPLSRGDWILVKQHLTAGEQQEMFARMLLPNRQLDPVKVAPGKVLAYLLDWSFTDFDDRPIRIAEQSEDVVRQALKDIDDDAFLEVQQAIETHEAAMHQAREQEKNAPDGANASSVTSPSAA